ncbi:hypothetical protein [Acinetobacter sp.]|uniref:DUF7487 domain-containing protein n=1 Tax=Acinetobacter sp. TaxID=472 RepID=UPI00388E7392
MNRHEILENMKTNIHFSKKLKSQYPEVYTQVEQYPGKQPKEKIWNYCHDRREVPKCTCGKQVNFSNAFSKGYNEFCCCKCAQLSEKTRANYTATMVETYGVTSNFAIPEVIENKKKTWMKTLGVDNPAKSTVVQQKITKTMDERFGPDARKNSFSRNMYSVYGVSNWTQVPEIYNTFAIKNSNKKYTCQSGKTIHVQGYEPWALNILFETYDEADVQCHLAVPSIRYNYEGVDRFHYPDIFIPSRNLIIEVKSGYTFKAMKEMCIAKGNAAIVQGYDYEIWSFDRDKNLTVITFPVQ